MSKILCAKAPRAKRAGHISTYRVELLSNGSVPGTFQFLCDPFYTHTLTHTAPGMCQVRRTKNNFTSVCVLDTTTTVDERKLLRIKCGNADGCLELQRASVFASRLDIKEIYVTGRVQTKIATAIVRGPKFDLLSLRKVFYIQMIRCCV